jgi:aldehyde dehydrogenase
MIYAAPNHADSKVEFKSRYGNFIGGEWIAPVKEQYFIQSVLNLNLFLKNR